MSTRVPIAGDRVWREVKPYVTEHLDQLSLNKFFDLINPCMITSKIQNGWRVLKGVFRHSVIFGKIGFWIQTQTLYEKSRQRRRIRPGKRGGGRERNDYRNIGQHCYQSTTWTATNYNANYSFQNQWRTPIKRGGRWLLAEPCLARPLPELICALVRSTPYQTSELQ